MSESDYERRLQGLMQEDAAISAQVEARFHEDMSEITDWAVVSGTLAVGSEVFASVVPGFKEVAYVGVIFGVTGLLCVGGLYLDRVRKYARNPYNPYNLQHGMPPGHPEQLG